MSELTGLQFVAGEAVAGTGEAFTAIDPVAGSALSPTFREAGSDQIDRACRAAGAAAPVLQACSRPQRAQLLRAIADGLASLGDRLLERVTAETALPRPRVQNELARTQLQLRQFADLIVEGEYLDVRIDHADTKRPGPPKPDLRSMRVPLGPVAVFGASNFPLAYSVAGGDTASALAAGCPVVVKAHPAHPGTSELVAGVVVAAVRQQGLPAGVFAMLHGRTPATGGALVQHPAITAVGFTGSLQAGRSLCALAAARPAPIPVFAEMGSMNPVLVLPKALAARGAAIAEQLVASATLAQGQFCTSPGLVAYVDGPGADAFVGTLRDRFAAANGGPAVHPSIRASFEKALAEVSALPVTTAACAANASGAATALRPVLLHTSAAVVLQQARLREEIYGPAVLAVACRDRAELLALVESLHGHLTGTVHGDGDDVVLHGDICSTLARRVGRLIGNGVPTGVEVCPSMVHGGPWPAASDARFTAVGSGAVARWLRPLCWQDWPADALPLELQEQNPLRVRRRVDGRLE